MTIIYVDSKGVARIERNPLDVIMAEAESFGQEDSRYGVEACLRLERACADVNELVEAAANFYYQHANVVGISYPAKARLRDALNRMKFGK